MPQHVHRVEIGNEGRRSSDRHRETVANQIAIDFKTMCGTAPAPGRTVREANGQFHPILARHAVADAPLVDPEGLDGPARRLQPGAKQPFTFGPLIKEKEG